LHEQLYSKNYFKEAWLELVIDPVAEIEGNPVYT
jgi:hypothetical protein